MKLNKLLWAIIGVGMLGLLVLEGYLLLTGQLRMGVQEVLIALICIFFMFGATIELEKP